jgi:hypothetical protein
MEPPAGIAASQRKRGKDAPNMVTPLRYPAQGVAHHIRFADPRRPFDAFA